MPCGFTYAHYREIFETAIAEGYQVVTLADWFQGKCDKNGKVLINRVDVDDNISRLWTMGAIFKELGIRASIFLRLHAPGYNLLFFDNVNLATALALGGNEIGLHAEVEDVRHICGLDAEALLRAELALFRDLLKIKCVGVASHGGRTPYNNLDFWKTRNPGDFDLLYEAYDEQLWNGCRYVSDSEFTRWKAYQNGTRVQGERRCACEHIKDGVPVLYLLTHTCSYYHTHIGEQHSLNFYTVCNKP